MSMWEPCPLRRAPAHRQIAVTIGQHGAHVTQQLPGQAQDGGDRPGCNSGADRCPRGPRLSACSGRRCAMAPSSMTRSPRVRDLPAGWTDRQEAGRYRLERRDDDALFGFAVGPQSWKRFLHPPVETLWTARRERRRLVHRGSRARETRKFAFIGVRACELHAIAIQDRVFLRGPYRGRRPTDCARQDAFIVAVNCGEAGGTCFCVSMETGPKAEAGFDLALTELIDGGAPRLPGRGRQRGRRAICSPDCRSRASFQCRSRGGRRGRRAHARARWAAAWRPTASRSCCKAISTIRAGTMSPSAA